MKEILEFYNNDINSTNIKKNTNNIIIEKILYKLNKFEELALKTDIDKKNIYTLDKLYFLNYKCEIPKNIFDVQNCPICDDELIDKSYLTCGHEFCPSCIIEIINSKLVCPICRKNIKCKGIIMPNLVPSKLKYLAKLFNKMFNEENENDDNVLIYVDTVMIAKGLALYINKELYPKNIRLKTCIVDQKNNNYKSCILICIKDKNFLCQNIKNIKNIIVLTNENDYIINPESLGYNYCHANEKIKIWFFELMN